MNENIKHKNDKIVIAYRYSNPLKWVLDMLLAGKIEEIQTFDVLNAKHEFELLQKERNKQ